MEENQNECMETPVTPEEEVEEVEATETKGDPKKTVRELLEVKRKLADAEEKLAAAEAREAELSDKHLRLAAEYENFRRRAAAEKTAAYTDGLEGALAKLLPILDNLERAALYQDGEKVAEGLAITAKAAAEAIASLGVETFGEVGEEFDPNLHNAIGHVENEELSENVIAEVYQKGYKKGDRVLRYAMVMVAN